MVINGKARTLFKKHYEDNTSNIVTSRITTLLPEDPQCCISVYLYVYIIVVSFEKERKSHCDENILLILITSTCIYIICSYQKTKSDITYSDTCTWDDVWKRYVLCKTFIISSAIGLWYD